MPRWGDFAVTRWRGDTTTDNFGSYIYVRDVRDGTVWSAGFQPTVSEADAYAVAFKEDRIEIVRSDAGLTTTELSILVSTEDDAEVRQSRSPAPDGACASSKSPLLQNSHLPDSRTTLRTRRFQSCSSKQNILPTPG